MKKVKKDLGTDEETAQANWKEATRNPSGEIDDPEADGFKFLDEGVGASSKKILNPLHQGPEPTTAGNRL